MTETKECHSCGAEQPLEEFERRPGQPYWLPPHAQYVRAQEPLLPLVEQEDCIVCFTVDTLRSTRGVGEVA